MERKFKSLSEEIDNYFEIECLDTMADVQGDVKKMCKGFVKKLKEEFRKEIIIDDFMVSIKEIERTIDKLAGDKLI